MARIQIELTDEQTSALEKLAKQRNMPLPDLIQESIAKFMVQGAPTRNLELRQRAMAVAARFRSGLGDLSRQHDGYLPGEHGPEGVRAKQ